MDHDSSPTPPPARRFEVRAAWVMGLALPLMEIARRRSDSSDLPAYVDDLVFGALLLWGATAASRGRRHGPGLVTGAWGVLCGAMWYSIFGQLQTQGPDDISGLPNGVVVAVKLAIAAVAVAAFVSSVRRGGASTERGRTDAG